MSWLWIGETLRVGNRAKSDDDTYIVERERLEKAFVTLVRVTSGNVISTRVDSFALLYSLLTQNYLLHTGELFIDIGEGLFAIGNATSSRVSFEVQHFPKTLATIETSIPDFAWFVANKVAEVTHSLAMADVDVRKYIQKFPPDLRTSMSRRTTQNS